MKHTVVAGLTAVCLAFAVPTEAGVYTTTYTGTNGPAATASFTFTTSDTIVRSGGGYNILSVTGYVNANAITGLIANPNAPNQTVSTGGGWKFDNVDYDASQLFDSDGLLFTTASGAEGNTLMVLTGTRRNGSQVEATLGIGIAYQSFTVVDFTDLVSLEFSKPLSGGFLNLDNIALGRSEAAVPETSKWAMMVGGLGFIGRAMRRRRTIVTVFA